MKKTLFAAYYSYLLLARSSSFLLEVFPSQIINNFGRPIIKPKLEAKFLWVKSWAQNSTLEQLVLLVSPPSL